MPLEEKTAELPLERVRMDAEQLNFGNRRNAKRDKSKPDIKEKFVGINRKGNETGRCMESSLLRNGR